MIEGIKKWWHRRCVNSQLNSFVSTVNLGIAQSKLNKAKAEIDKIRGKSNAIHDMFKADRAIEQGNQILEWVRLFRIAWEPSTSKEEQTKAKEALRGNVHTLSQLIRDFELPFENFNKANHEILDMFIQYEQERSIK